jgi:hypothetical protein
MSNYNSLMQIYLAMMACGADERVYKHKDTIQKPEPKKSWLSKVIEMPKQDKIKIANTPDEELNDDLILVKEKLKEYGYGN